MQYDTTVDTAWAEGELRIRSGESIRFTGQVTGVSLDDIELVFHAIGDGEYRYATGELGGYADAQTQALIVKHVEQALMDLGFAIDPRVAADEYEPAP